MTLPSAFSELGEAGISAPVIDAGVAGFAFGTPAAGFKAGR